MFLVQIIYFNIKIKKIDVGEIKPWANLHKVSNIKHVILGTIYVFKKNRNIFYSQQMLSKSWSSLVLARSSRQFMGAAVQLICFTILFLTPETLLSMEIWQCISKYRSAVRRSCAAPEPRRLAAKSPLTVTFLVL